MELKFWNWSNNAETGERTLKLNGPIAETSWFGDEVTPQIFRDELNAGKGDVVVWINSPGGDVFAAAQIYNMLKEYKGKVTVRIDGIAASAATMVAMAGDTVEMSPVGYFFIHNPSTGVFGDEHEMKAAIDMLGEVKESIINAYELKTKLPRKQLAEMMDIEKGMNAKQALEYGFIDKILYANEEDMASDKAVAFSRRSVTNSFLDKFRTQFADKKKPEETRVSAEQLQKRLSLIAH